MKQLIITLFIALFPLPIFAQTSHRGQIKGQINDSDTQLSLSAATVNCLRSKDSSRVTLTFTDKNGFFHIDSLPFDDYTLYISYLGYKSLIYPLSLIKGEKIRDIGIISMKRTGFNLAQVEISETKDPIRITKDTIEYNSIYFKTKENALVEDLFTKIPGLEIDKNGKISINGQLVNKILVDGKPLFGGDNLKIISKNIQADLIDKVQFINQRKEQKESHNLNTSQSETIINLTIKESKLNIFSGELTTGYGTSNRFAVKSSLSRFRSRQQLMLLGNGDNINGAMDSKSIANTGMQRNWNGGISYNEEINKKMTISANYIMNNGVGLDQRNSVRENFTTDLDFHSTQESDNRRTDSNNDYSIQLEYKLDSFQSISFNNQFSISRSTNFFKSNYESTKDQLQLNSGNTNSINNSSFNSVSGGLRYDKRFLKKGRQLSIILSYGKGNGMETAVNKSDNKYFPTSLELIKDSINQKTVRDIHNNKLFILLSLTEPITKNGFLTLSLAEDHTKNSSNKVAYNFNNLTKLYDIESDSLSSNFNNSPIQHYAKANWLFQKEKLDYSISVASLLTKMTNNNLSTNSYSSTMIHVFLPDANFNYSFRSNKRLRFSYIKTAEFPEISQLQPVPDMSDPLHIKIGNPTLKPMTVHMFSFLYNKFNTRSLCNFTISIGSRFMKNQIINASEFDSLGREIIRPFNINGGYMANLDIGTSLPLKVRQDFLTFNTSAIIGQTPTFLNGKSGFRNDITLAQSIRLNYSYKKIFDCIVAGNISFNMVQYSDQGMNIQKYLNGGFTYTGNINIPYNIIINTNFYYGWATGRTEGYNVNPFILNASISKNLFSHKQGQLKLQAFDLLKQNVGIKRNVQDTYIEDIRTKVLEQCFLISFSYFLGKRN
ncbi:CarboxypepD_reg-like domain-containing protein [Chitinophaga ginsengisegetis]|uniref:CarboxypepD_reg-like domain-containing protein n=1 Tax=Chitinophaga ginsengisegetis TaxID=393003 RepID=A0A1T5NV54_9BACT|nr:outer membrane beta-barrel protein [Chitinophaga ginsengisegetis]SKD04335.1 CarboxypepD_reg-like domain-containing protein [Chitinophaga ginsengisegetis]